VDRLENGGDDILVENSHHIARRDDPPRVPALCIATLSADALVRLIAPAFIQKRRVNFYCGGDGFGQSAEFA
jgi:hypothetical protein